MDENQDGNKIKDMCEQQRGSIEIIDNNKDNIGSLEEKCSQNVHTIESGNGDKGKGQEVGEEESEDQGLCFEDIIVDGP